jgi:hypothetical protein
MEPKAKALGYLETFSGETFSGLYFFSSSVSVDFIRLLTYLNPKTTARRTTTDIASFLVIGWLRNKIVAIMQLCSHVAR